MRVPTWAPFRLQVYFNGHGWLARQLTQAGITFETADNAFLRLADPVAAQCLADSLDAIVLHRRLDDWARRCCTVVHHFCNGVRWSFMQVEYATGDLRAHIAGLTPARASYQIKRLRTHGLIKKIAHTSNYSFTKLGRRASSSPHS